MGKRYRGCAKIFLFRAGFAEAMSINSRIFVFLPLVGAGDNLPRKQVFSELFYENVLLVLRTLSYLYDR